MKQASLEEAMMDARRDGIEIRRPDAPRLTRTVTVHGHAALEAALAVAGSDILLGSKFALSGEVRIRANDIRLRGFALPERTRTVLGRRVAPDAHRESTACLWIEQGVQRIAIENLTAGRITWQPPHRFDDRLGQPVTNPSLQASDVTLRNLTLTGQRGFHTLDITGNKTLIERCKITSSDSYCLWGSSRSALTASPTNPTPFGITDLIVTGCMLTNTGSGLANLRVLGAVRQLVSGCTFNTGMNFSLRAHEGSHQLYWADSVLNGGGFMLTDHAATPRDTIGSVFLRRLAVNYTNANGPISTPAASEGGLARIGATGPSYVPITRPRVVMDQVVILDARSRGGTFTELLGERVLPPNWTLTRCEWRTR